MKKKGVLIGGALILTTATVGILALRQNKNSYFISKNDFSKSYMLASSDANTVVTINFSDANMANAVYQRVKSENVIEHSRNTIKMYQSKIDEVETLDLSQRGIANIDGIQYFTNLKTLNLGSNTISNVSQIGALTKLVNLDLSRNVEIKDISALRSCTSLTKLNVSGNSIIEIDSVASMKNLLELDISDNNIAIITPIQQLTKLTKLNAYKNNIVNIQEIVGLESLKDLNLSSNQLASDKNDGLKNISRLVKLERLDISSNIGLNDLSPIVETKEVKGIRNPITYEVENNYSEYRQHIYELTGITPISMRPEEEESMITTLDVPILENLRSLNISNNGLDSSGFSIVRDLYKLNELIANDNQIDYIFDIGEMRALKILNLDHNRLTDISSLLSRDNIMIQYGMTSDYNPLYRTHCFLKLPHLTNVSLAYNYNKNEDMYGIENITNIYEYSEVSGDTSREVTVSTNFSNYNELIRLDLSGNKIYDIETIKNKKFATNGISLADQTIFRTINRREENDEFQAVMLPNLFSSTIESGSNVYSADEYKYRTAYRRDSNKNIEHDETIDTNACGKINEDKDITDKRLVFIDTYKLYENSQDYEKGTNVATVEIVGGNAVGSKIIFNAADSGGIESLIFKDANLYTVTLTEMQRRRENEYEHEPLAVEYINQYKLINISESNLQQVRVLDANNANIHYVDGIKRLSSLENLRIGENTIQEVGEISLLENITDLTINKNAISTLEGFNIDRRDISDARGSRKHINEVTKKMACANMLTYLNASENINEAMGCKGISKIDPLIDFTAIKQLYLQKNNISNISPIENLENVETLNLSVNNISDLSKITKLYNLKTLILSSNQITDNQLDYVVQLPKLSYLDLSGNKLRNIGALNQRITLSNLYLSKNNIDSTSYIPNLKGLSILDMSANRVSDLSGLSALTSITKLYLANNKISDVTPLIRLTKLTELDLKFNKIGNVSTLEALKAAGLSGLHLENQRIVIETMEEQSEYRIELPELFKKAQISDNIFYSPGELSLTKCTLNNNIVTVNNLFNDIAVVEINEPSVAQNSTLVIGEGLRGTIEYSTKNLTKEDVVATLSRFNRPNDVRITVTNNGGEKAYTFDKNGTFRFEFEDDYGFEGRATATVDWIDKEAPKLQIGYEKKEQEQNGVITNVVVVKITSNEQVKPVEGWNLSNDKLSLTKTYSETKTETVKVADLIGNETQIQVKVSIDEPEEDLKIESSIYEISDIKKPEYITKVAENTTVENFLKNIETNTKDVVVKNSDGTVVDNKKLVGTGMTVEFNKTTIYTIVITGDLNGDGIIKGSDLSILKRSLVGKKKLEGAYLKASDINLDGNIKPSDLSKLKRSLVGK